MLHAIDKSAFQQGEYVGYGANTVWHIRRMDRGWRATPRNMVPATIIACTLLEIDGALQALPVPKQQYDASTALMGSI